MSARLFSRAVLLGVLCGALAIGETIRVPADEPTIQIAIQVAEPFDTIIVAPGTYSEAISFGGKVIVVQSEDPNDPTTVAGTIIDAGDPAYGDYPSNPTIDIDGNPRIAGARVDIGAFEFRAAYTGTDFDGDGTTDVCDRCDRTAIGIPVNSEGRPYADLNLDLSNYAKLQHSVTGPGQNKGKLP